MNQSDRIVDIDQLEKGLRRVGLSLTEPELSQLNFGHIVSLETLELGKIGSLFILASATSAANLERSKQPIAFQDLPKATQNCQGCSGIPFYCWHSDLSGKRCLYLTIVDGKPAIRASCNSTLSEQTEYLTSGLKVIASL